MNVSEVLDRAADVLEEDGWCQYSMHDELGRYCALGAIKAVTPDPDAFAERGYATRALRDYLSPTRPFQISKWNDNPDRTKEEVIDALQQAARLVRAGG